MSKTVSPYVKGRSFEYRVKEFLARQGYFVTRAARSAFPDLVALRRGEVLLVECKLNGGLSLDDRVKFLSLGEDTGARCLVAYSKDGKIKFRVIRR